MLKAALRDTLVYGLSAILTKGLAIFLLPLYTRVLSPAQYGAYDLLITLAVLANLMVALEVSQGLARYWADAQPAERSRYASTSLIFTVAMYGVFLVLALSFSQPLSGWLLGSNNLVPAFRLGVGFIALNGIYYLLLNQFRWELRSLAYAMVSLVYALLTLGFSAWLCLGLGWKLEGVMLAQLLAAGFALLVSAWLLRRTYGWVFDVARLASMLRFSVPLVPAGLAVFISLYINRFALNHYMSLEEVGLFGLGSRIAGLAVLLIMGIQAALTPLVYQHYREPETPARIARLFGWFVALALPGCLFLALFARELLLLFATPAFSQAAGLVMYLAPALLLSQMYIFAPGIVIRKKTHWQLWVTLLAAAVSMLGNWLLVPVWGSYGAAVATLLSSVVFFLAWVFISQLLYRVPYAGRGGMVAVLAFAAGAWAGSWLDAQEMGSVWLLLSKTGVLLAMFGTVVVAGLLPVADLRAGWIYLRQRLARAA